jgi:hypothetical protein
MRYNMINKFLDVGKIVATTVVLIMLSFFITMHLQIGPPVVDAIPYRVIAIIKGGTGATTADGARTNLGLSIGTDVVGTSLVGNTDYAENIPYEDYYACDDTCVTANAVNLSGKGSHIKFDDAGTDEDTIDDFTNQVAGGIYSFLFVDEYWTIDFSGSNLYGHNGIDWQPTAGDSMTCRSIDGTNLYCEVSRPTALDIDKYYDMPLDSTPDTDDRWHGPTAEYLAGEALSQWELVYVTHDTGTVEIKLWDANLTTVEDLKPIGVVIESGGIADTATGTVGILAGIGRNDGWTFVNNQDEGKTVYGGTTAGALVVAAPSTTGDRVCAVGTLLDEDEIQFNFGLCTNTEVP